jgi:hypothetical protein
MGQSLPTSDAREVSAKQRAVVETFVTLVSDTSSRTDEMSGKELSRECFNFLHRHELWDALVKAYRDVLEENGVEVGDERELSTFRPALSTFGLVSQSDAALLFVKELGGAQPPGKFKKREKLRRDCRFVILEALGRCLDCGEASRSGPFKRRVSDPFGQVGTYFHSNPRAIYCGDCADGALIDSVVAARHRRESRALSTLKGRLSV